MQMNQSTTLQKWENLTILIIAKAEHKEKFNKYIEYNDYEYNENNLNDRSLKEDIENKRMKKMYLIVTLGFIIKKKFEKYITERKITIPKFDDITEYNCETDCPVCFEKYTIPNERGFEEDGSNKKVEGDICGHPICYSCYYKVADYMNNKCPICREKLDQTLLSDDEDEIEE